MPTQSGLAKICCVYAGLVFGIYWIPLRALGRGGFEGMWAVVVFGLAPMVLLSPLFAARWRVFVPGRVRFHVCGVMIGSAFALYAAAFMYTEVMRVIALFYLMPIWGFLIARLVGGEVITPVRWLSMAFGLAGLLVLFSFDSGPPLPRNAGDWMALASGMIWAGGSMLLFTDREDPVNYTLAFLLWSCIVALVLAVFATWHGAAAAPAWSRLVPELYWLLPFALLVLIPAAYATVFGPTRLNPGVVGLLFMTEVSVGTITAALFAGEPFGAREICGVALITLAGVAEPMQILSRSLASRAL